MGRLGAFRQGRRWNPASSPDFPPLPLKLASAADEAQLGGPEKPQFRHGVHRITGTYWNRGKYDLFTDTLDRHQIFANA